MPQQMKVVPKCLSKSEKLEKTWTSHKRFLFFLSLFLEGNHPPQPLSLAVYIFFLFSFMPSNSQVKIESLWDKGKRTILPFWGTAHLPLS